MSAYFPFEWQWGNMARYIWEIPAPWKTSATCPCNKLNWMSQTGIPGFIEGRVHGNIAEGSVPIVVISQRFSKRNPSAFTRLNKFRVTLGAGPIKTNSCSCVEWERWETSLLHSFGLIHGRRTADLVIGSVISFENVQNTPGCKRIQAQTLSV